MATQSKPVETTRSGPPPWLFRNVINPMMKTILRSPLHGMLSDSLMIINFTGRKSGKKYSTPVAYHVMDDKTIMFGTRGKWWKNFANGERVTVRIKGTNYQATAQPITDSDTVWQHLQNLLERYDNDYRRVGIMLPPDSGQDMIERSGREMIMLRLTLNAPL